MGNAVLRHVVLIVKLFRRFLQSLSITDNLITQERHIEGMPTSYQPNPQLRVISAVVLLTSIACLVPVSVSDEQINKHPLMAVNLIFSLVAACFSIYSLIVSVLLLWQARQMKGNIFICSLWYVSHLSMMTLYCILFVAKVVVCIIRKHYFNAVFTAFVGILYQGIFIYFTIVVNSYLHSLHQERYL